MQTACPATLLVAGHAVASLYHHVTKNAKKLTKCHFENFHLKIQNREHGGLCAAIFHVKTRCFLQ